MKRMTLYITPILAILAMAAFLSMGQTRASQPSAESKPAMTREGWIAGPGRVEPVSEEVRVGAEIRGKLKAVRVEEGDRVRKGQIVAILENDDYMAQCASAEAQLRQRQAELRRVVNGARAEERREAQAAVKE